MYEIKLNQFEGPLGLLLEMIERRKLFISDVSLAEIANSYVEYLKQFEKFPIEDVAAFVSVASTLMLIKSRSLMPGMNITVEEEHSIEELENRLKVYRLIKKLSEYPEKLFGKNIIFSREGFKGVEIGFIEPRGLDTELLHEALKNAVDNLPTKEVLPEVQVKKIISLGEKIEELSRRVQGAMEISFSDFAQTKDGADKEECKIEIIVSFLAMLELTKMGIIIVKQQGLFSNIDMCSTEQNQEFRI